MKRSGKLALALFFLLVLLTSCGQFRPVSPSESKADRSSVGSFSSESPPQPDVPDLPPADSSHPEGPSEPEPEPESVPEPVPDPEPEPEPASEIKPSKTTKLYILMYHHFVEGDGANCDNWSLPIYRFREDLQWLSDHGYTTLLPSQLANGEPLPERAVMLTFDDGYASNYRLAYPLLQEFNAKAVISIITSCVDDGAWDGYLTWDMCREMQDSGLVEFGSHTHRLHMEGKTNILRLSGEGQAEYKARVFPDLETSIQLIQSNLGSEPIFFAYPGGEVDRWADSFLKEYFSVTVTTKHGQASIADGLYKLRRCNISLSAPVGTILPD